jgi:hypothetical protein
VVEEAGVDVDDVAENVDVVDTAVVVVVAGAAVVGTVAIAVVPVEPAPPHAVIVRLSATMRRAKGRIIGRRR